MSGSVLDVDYSEVNQAVALIEQFELLGEDLKGFVEALPTKYKDEGEVYCKKYNSLLSILDSDVSDEFDVLAEKDLSGIQSKSIIERFGISDELIRLRKDGKTINELALTFRIATGTISRFFRYYDKLKPTEKKKLQRRSVFNTIDELEELAVMIKRNIARLEGQDDEVNVRLIGELRQTIIAAASLAEKMANHERFEKFTQAVIRVLSDELPAKRTIILKEIQGSYERVNNNNQLLGN